MWAPCLAAPGTALICKASPHQGAPPTHPFLSHCSSSRELSSRGCCDPGGPGSPASAPSTARLPLCGSLAITGPQPRQGGHVPSRASACLGGLGSQEHVAPTVAPRTVSRTISGLVPGPVKAVFARTIQPQPFLPGLPQHVVTSLTPPNTAEGLSCAAPRGVWRTAHPVCSQRLGRGAGTSS